MPTLSPFPPGGSLVAYLRDSGGDNQDLSVPQQNAEITAWCKANNLNLTHLFKDEARPGSSTVSRVGFLEMIRYFEKKPQPPELGVIVWKFSRFSRDIDDSQYFKGLLRRQGLIIHSLNENIPQGLDGRLFEAAIEWMNARFLKDLSEDVKRGLRNNVTQHHAIGGTPPRGFRPGPPINLGIRRNGTPTTNPGGMLLGPKVTLLNEYSASDGDIFPFRFRENGLGKLIGKRSWGGVVGIAGTLSFTDGGSMNKPEFAPYSKDGKKWVIEGHGVDPDIVVDNDPAREFRGEDQQLDKGIEVILEELKTHGQTLPPPPAWPDKSRIQP